MHTISQPRCMKRTQRSYQRSLNWWKSEKSTAGYSYLVTPTVNMMWKDDRCFVCDNTGHIGYHCPNVQCCNCNSFGHVTQDCSEKIPWSGTPCHHDRSHSWSPYNHNCRDTPQSFHHRCNQGKCFDRSGPHHQSQCSRSSSNYWRHTSCSLSHHHSSSWYPFTNRCSRWHSHWITPDCHSHNSYMTQHSSCQSYSCDYSTDHSWSRSRHSYDAAWRSHMEKASKPLSQKASPMDSRIRRRHYSALTVGVFLTIGWWL